MLRIERTPPNDITECFRRQKARPLFWSIPMGLPCVTNMQWTSSMHETDHRNREQCFHKRKPQSHWPVSTSVDLSDALCFPYPSMPDSAPAVRMKSGIGGVAPRVGGVKLRAPLQASKLAERMSGLGLDGRLPDRIRFKVRPLMTWPAIGAAVTTVPGVGVGGGVGLFVRKSGWIWHSSDEDLWRLNGRVKFGVLYVGDCGRKGPSSAFAGDSGRLPGIGSRPDPADGGVDCKTASRICGPTAEVSQLSKLFSRATWLRDKLSKDERLESRVTELWRGRSLVSEDVGRTTPESEDRRELMASRLVRDRRGVCSAKTREESDWTDSVVAGLVTSCIEVTLSRSSAAGSVPFTPGWGLARNKQIEKKTIWATMDNPQMMNADMSDSHVHRSWTNCGMLPKHIFIQLNVTAIKAAASTAGTTLTTQREVRGRGLLLNTPSPCAFDPRYVKYPSVPSERNWRIVAASAGIHTGWWATVRVTAKSVTKTVVVTVSKSARTPTERSAGLRSIVQVCVLRGCVGDKELFTSQLQSIIAMQ